MSLKDSELTSVIIAGGKSLRFGEPKSLSMFNGKLLIQYSIDVADKISNKKLIVYGNDNHFQDFQTITIPDVHKNCGPLSGIFSALIYIQDGWIATIPCDTPFLISEIYEKLVSAKDGFKPVIASSPSGLEPLIGLWHTSATNQIEKAILNKQFRIIDVLEKLNFVKVPFSTKHIKNYKQVFFNINTKSDLKLLQQNYSV